MIFKCEDCVSWISQFMTLMPGDVIMTGTPPGVGCFRSPPLWLKDGDVVTCEIDGIGSITNTVRATKAEYTIPQPKLSGAVEAMSARVANLEARMASIQASKTAGQETKGDGASEATANEARRERDLAKEQVRKLQYRLTHVMRALDEEEKGTSKL